MGPISRFRMRHAAKQYARQLGPHLQRAYGAAKQYSPAQIRAAGSKLGLNPKYIILGYATFMSEDDCAHAAENAPLRISYGEARELVAHFQPLGRFGSSHHYESGLGMTGGLDSGSS